LGRILLELRAVLKGAGSGNQERSRKIAEKLFFLGRIKFEKSPLEMWQDFPSLFRKAVSSEKGSYMGRLLWRRCGKESHVAFSVSGRSVKKDAPKAEGEPEKKAVFCGDFAEPGNCPEHGNHPF
jgi:hypothetical protein